MRTLFDHLENNNELSNENGGSQSANSSTATKRKRTNQINDFDMDNWQGLGEIWTDSLWLIPNRDKSGAHTSEYHGNFVPQIPRQVIQRYSKTGEVVLDGFLGSGTTAIEANRLERKCIGVELQPKIADLAKQIINSDVDNFTSRTEIIVGSSADETIKLEIDNSLEKLNEKHVSLVILHPPYHDIIKFSENPNDLSNTATVEDFCESFGKVIENTTARLTKGRYLIIVIGDKYANSEWIPLSFYTMQEAMKRRFALKSVVVKDMQNNRAKQNQQQLWRYRALGGGFYIFKHEYIFILRKK